MTTRKQFGTKRRCNAFCAANDRYQLKEALDTRIPNSQTPKLIMPGRSRTSHSQQYSAVESNILNENVMNQAFDDIVVVLLNMVCIGVADIPSVGGVNQIH